MSRRRISGDVQAIASSTPLLRQSSIARPSRLKDVQTLLFSDYLNLLLVMLPFAILSGTLKWSPEWVFLTNFFSLIPLASLLSFATEELSVGVGETIGALFNVTFGNATEMIVSIVALRGGQVKLVQTAMLGSILSCLLWVLGSSFVVGGIRYAELKFSDTVAQTMSSLMFVATGSLILPAAFEAGLPGDKSTHAEVLALSRGTSIVMLIIYLLYLFFQLKTHYFLFESVSTDQDGAIPVVSPLISASTIAIAAIAVSFCSDWLVGSIDEVVDSFGISKTFIGLILLPVVGNAAQSVTAIKMGYKNKMDLAIGVTLGSSMQVALFLIPFLVILGWIIDQPMTLNFETFQAAVIFVAVLITNYLIVDGKSNWMEGAMLLGVYTIVAISYWLYPDLDAKP